VQARLKRLKRIAALYDVVERMASIELQRAMSVVREAERAIERQRTIVCTAGVDRREALMKGDRIGWSLAETQQEVAARRWELLEEVRVEREASNEAAREVYAASRLKSEQMNRVVGGVAERVEIEEERRFQGTTDDRFLSRKLWTKARDEARQASR
jgi:hypothetical protein